MFYGRVLFVSSDGARTSGIWQVTPCRLLGGFDCDEVSVMLAGEMTIVPENGASFQARPGDLLLFPRGYKCELHVHTVVRKFFSGRPSPVLPSAGDQRDRTALEARPPRTRVGYGDGQRALLDAAVRIVARGGVDDLTYRNIAAEAGLSRSLVSYYFPSRQDVIAQTLTHAARQATDRLDETLGPMSISSLIDTLSPEADRISPSHLLSYGVAEQPGLRAAMRDVYRAALRVVRRSLPNASDESTARLVLAIVSGISIQREVLGEQDIHSDISSRLEELLEAWITVQGSPADGAAAFQRSDSRRLANQ